MKNKSTALFICSLIFWGIILAPLQLHANNIENIVNTHAGLTDKQKLQINKYLYYFGDNVFLAEKTSKGKNLLYHDIMDAVLLENGNSETIAKSLYYSFLSINQNLKYDECFSLVIPLSFSKIQPSLFLEYISFYNYLVQLNVKKNQAVAVILFLNNSNTTPMQLLSNKDDFVQLITNKQENYILDYISLKQSKLQINTPKKFQNWLSSPSGLEYNKLKTHLNRKYNENYSQNILNSMIRIISKQKRNSKDTPKISKQLHKLDKANIPPDLVLSKLKASKNINTIKNDPEINKITTFTKNKKQKLMSRIKSFLGTPYKWGGNTRNGTDCSGFTQTIMAEMGIKTPRTAHDQIKKGKAISKQNLQLGDLVFFATSGNQRVSHVGIYIGKNEFVHASSSKGVRVDNLSNNYYITKYIGSRRILKL